MDADGSSDNESSQVYTEEEVKAVSDAAVRVEEWFEDWRGCFLSGLTDEDEAILDYMLLNLYAVQETKDAVWSIIDAVHYKKNIVH